VFVHVVFELLLDYL